MRERTRKELEEIQAKAGQLIKNVETDVLSERNGLWRSVLAEAAHRRAQRHAAQAKQAALVKRLMKQIASRPATKKKELKKVVLEDEKKGRAKAKEIVRCF